ncbi:hypothetical protein RCO48_13135 [Peribacillus frigoritolerans]|nr:hypothetical protein [Peribacillus frigoritolerans]
MQKSNLNGLGESIFSMMEMKDAIFLLAGIPIAESFVKKKIPPQAYGTRAGRNIPDDSRIKTGQEYLYRQSRYNPAL